jgi:hypothetical protein
MDAGDAFFLIEQVLLAQDDQSEAGRTGVHPCRGLDVLRDRWRVPSDQGEGVVLAPAEPEFGAQTPEGDEGDPGRGGASEADLGRFRFARVAILTHETPARAEQDEGGVLGRVASG